MELTMSEALEIGSTSENLKKFIEEQQGDLRLVRDNQKFSPCGKDDDPCLCNDFDLVIDQCERLKEKILE